MSETRFSKRMWVYFRAGHGQYLVFPISMTSFILIFYRLLIEQIPFIENYFPSLWVFIIVFIPFYIPVAIFVGKNHYSKQLETDFIEMTKYNPPLNKIINDLDQIKKKLKIKD